MDKEHIIKCCKCTLVLYENELFNGLKPDILQSALKRGKRYRRAETVRKHQERIKPENCNCLTSQNKPRAIERIE